MLLLLLIKTSLYTVLKQRVMVLKPVITQRLYVPANLAYCMVTVLT